MSVEQIICLSLLLWVVGTFPSFVLLKKMKSRKGCETLDFDTALVMSIFWPILILMIPASIVVVYAHAYWVKK